MESPTKGNVSHDGNDTDFVWDDYLEDTNSIAAPPTAFSHVEYSLESGFKVGMKLEIPSAENCSSYWVASVIMTCGELLSLRYAGYGDDRSADFWFNIKSGEFHPIGWCTANKKKLWPPKSVEEKCEDINSLLATELNSQNSITSSLPTDLAASFMPIDQIKTGMKLEVIEEIQPGHIWIATIEQNVGGRLLLRYDGVKDCAYDFWLFYLSDRLQPVEYGKIHNLIYTPPAILKHLDINWNEVMNISFKIAENLPFPAHIFEPKLPLETHEFKEGMKLEAVNLKTLTDVSPATVSKVVNEFYFIVTLDNHCEKTDDKITFCCHSNTPFIFPIKWAEENEIDLKLPAGYAVQDKFSWDDYLQFCNAEAAPAELFQMSFMNMGFENGMKCEAADPFNPSVIKASTIVKVIEPLMWLQFDNEETNNKTIITSIMSYDVYPVGWCASNSYPLQTPSNYKPKAKLNISPIKSKEEESEKLNQAPIQLTVEIQSHGKSWCPKIFFNHRCFTGPLLSKSRLAELPQAIGPGPVNLVLHEVISRVVNIAYKSSQVLQILQTTGRCRSAMQQQIIKAKYKGKSYRAVIEIVRNTEQVEGFCKEICTKLECCPYLFGPMSISNNCPSSCHTQTKTKFGYNFVKKQKKVGRPPLSANNNNVSSSNSEETIKRGPGRKKKRKHWTHLLNIEKNNFQKSPKSRDSSENDETQKQSPERVEKNNEEAMQTNDNEEIKVKDEEAPFLKDEERDTEDRKIPLLGKKKLKNTPSSNIVTRGAKLPNFGLWHHVTSFHSRRGRPRTRPIRPFPVIPGRKVGRPVGSTKKAIAAAHLKAKRLLEIAETVSKEEAHCQRLFEKENELKHARNVSKLTSSPLDWSVEEVVKYIQKTECAPLAPLIKDQEIDGQALLMLTKNNVQEFLHLKPEPAEKFCFLVKELKYEFFSHFAT